MKNKREANVSLSNDEDVIFAVCPLIGIWNQQKGVITELVLKIAIISFEQNVRPVNLSSKQFHLLNHNSKAKETNLRQIRNNICHNDFCWFTFWGLHDRFNVYKKSILFLVPRHTYLYELDDNK